MALAILNLSTLILLPSFYHCLSTTDLYIYPTPVSLSLHVYRPLHSSYSHLSISFCVQAFTLIHSLLCISACLQSVTFILLPSLNLCLSTGLYTHLHPTPFSLALPDYRLLHSSYSLFSISACLLLLPFFLLLLFLYLCLSTGLYTHPTPVSLSLFVYRPLYLSIPFSLSLLFYRPLHSSYSLLSISACFQAFTLILLFSLSLTAY